MQPLKYFNSFLCLWDIKNNSKIAQKESIRNNSEQNTNEFVLTGSTENSARQPDDVE
jgi:hypothetical protein